MHFLPLWFTGIATPKEGVHMFRFIPLLLIVALVGCTPAPTPQELETAYRNDLQRLVQVSLTERLRPQLEETYKQRVTALLPADPPPSETATRIVAEEVDAGLDRKMADLETRLTAIFTRHFTPEEVRQLLAFHTSEVGRKSMAAAAEMSRESQEAVQEWTRNFEQDLFEGLMKRFAAEGIEF
jgi:hypothetical protein